ncbi:MAG: hypothetical protein QF632_02900 [Candidatus Woesearchaeota archaeon]|jgi:hypothetical protein|nr:hypothetical protein [Candidatus Woesearchaeota archaeon]MDP7323684.1 hypothetical protein [Candidatus Woesearchaeota archaeon]|tara:strand:+ start:608 stop:1072 length:465 start_codon:yes stop_codon:yes gene_type:complete
MSTLRWSVEVARVLQDRGINDRIIKTGVDVSMGPSSRISSPQRRTTLVSGINRVYIPGETHNLQWGTVYGPNQNTDFVTFSHNYGDPHLVLSKPSGASRFHRVWFYGNITPETQETMDHLVSLPVNRAIREAVDFYFMNTFEHNHSNSYAYQKQ